MYVNVYVTIFFSLFPSPSLSLSLFPSLSINLTSTFFFYFI